MADMKSCGLNTAHEMHSWMEKVDSQPEDTEGWRPTQKTKYHMCVGVSDFLADTLKNGKFLRREGDDTIYSMNEEIIASEPGEPAQTRMRRTERLVTLDSVYERVVIEPSWVKIQQRTCWCCTCDNFNNDPYCRNHNIGFGMRPCDIHGTPGQKLTKWGEEGQEILTEEIPQPVSVVRAEQANKLRNPDLWR